jgi:hypothetical protein
LASTSVFFQPDATVDERLEGLGVSADILTQAVLVGEAARASCTFNDPPILPGVLAWGRTVRGLAELLAPKGWIRRDVGNFSTILDKRLGIAIAVATGDEATGLSSGEPRTKYPKGPNTVKVVAQNYRQLRLFDEPGDDKTPPEAVLTWILLIARVENEVRCELSLPDSIGDDGRVEGWRERIILPPIRVDSVGGPPDSADLEATDVIDIVITPRKSE